MEELERLGLEEEEDYSPLATVLTNTILNDEYVRKMRGGWWQGEYALEAVTWVASMPSDIGAFSGWDSSKYEEEYLKAFGGRTVYPAKVDSDGAGTFAALRTLGDAIEQQRHCGEDDNDTSMIGALHLGRRHRAGGLARDGRRGERAPQHVAR